jgi:DNA helicase-2/ATP-dependent DNA helicase PcrA
MIAAAGSGKTTYIVNDASASVDERILITTFTQANAEAICERLVQKNICIPAHITVQTWFSFLLEHGVRPYQHWDERVAGMEWASEKSGYRFTNKNNQKVYWGEKDFYQYYFNKSLDVYSDKLSKLVVQCNKQGNGAVVQRLEKIYTRIFIDEVQDMAGYDLDILKLFFNSTIDITMVGDPRQVVYLTHPDAKYKKYQGRISEFIGEKCKSTSCDIDATTLNRSFRNAKHICEFSAQLYTDFPSCESCQSCRDNHNGLYFLKEKDIDDYFTVINPVLLRWSKTSGSLPYQGYNFGDSKGLEFSHVVILPTKDMIDWVYDNSVQLKSETRAKLYVGITRARYSVAFVVPDNYSKIVPGISYWSKVS